MARRDERDPLDFSTFVVLGEGLAAGVGHFSLTADVQSWSFPAQLAERLDVDLKQPLMQPPGLGSVLGLPELPPLVPNHPQTTVREDFPPAAADLDNLSVPGFTVVDALFTRPRPPVVDRRSNTQTLANFILGLPALLRSDAGAPTQVEYAAARRPTVALVELGFHEAATAAIAGDPEQLPDVAEFGANYGHVLEALRSAQIVATTVPDPLATAYFSSVETAAEICRTEPAFLKKHFGFAKADLITLPALLEVGYQLTARHVTGKLPAGAVVPAAVATKLRRGVAAMNDAIRAAAAEVDALVYDLHALFARLAEKGAKVGDRHLSADLLGGIYLLNGLFPGRTGHALIAADLLAFLGREGGVDAAPIDVEAVAADDANTLSQLAPGPTFTTEFLEPRTPADLPPAPPFDPSQIPIWPIQTVYPGTPFDIGGFKEMGKCGPLVGVPAGGLYDPHLETPLVLPEGLEQTLDLNPRGSFFGDALSAIDSPDEEPFLTLPDGTGVFFGLNGNTFFGGLAMTDSPLRGKVHMKFTEPDAAGNTHFEISHPGGLAGKDGVLAAPQFFKLPSQLNFVQDVPGLISSGDLNLNTGVVRNLHYNVLFMNTAILSLFGVNPNLPPVAMTFPGFPNSGSTGAVFEQRADGKLDVTFSGDLFLPLGKAAGDAPIRFPLPFANPMMQCASIVTRGTSLHPHLHFTTKEDLGPECGDDCADIPQNTVVEFTPMTHNTNFGDVFGLHVDELGGEGTGRSHLLGRLRVQFGPRAGDHVPVAIAFLPPGGLLSDAPLPLVLHPPGTGRGLIGFNEILRFPRQVYQQSGLACANDANNITVAAIDLKTGRVHGALLRRSWVVQALFLNLVQVEPCTPGDSFLYRGPARFERGPGDETVFRFNGEVYLPYPKGFRFPSADGHSAFTVVEESRLDPFLRLQAMSDVADPQGVLQGKEKLMSSIGQLFSYEYEIPCDPTAKNVRFRYTNHTEEGTFELVSLSWVSYTNSRRARVKGGAVDTVTFGGFGTWSKDPGGVHQVSVHISTSKKQPYVGIQVDGGLTSNVNTKPDTLEGSRA